jgi:hypothetical protein
MYSTAIVDLTPDQKRRMLHQIKNGKTPGIRLTNSQLKRGKVPLPVTKTQLNKIREAKKTGKGLNLKFTKTQIKKGGFLPLLLPILAALGATAGGAAGIAKAVNDAKSNARQLEEIKRHNATMEAVALRGGKGLKKIKKIIKKKTHKKTNKQTSRGVGRGYFLKPAFH